MNLLLASFFEQYGLIIILVVAFALIMVYYYLKSKKYRETEDNFQNSLKVGDKVKTYSGFYGTVENITNTTDGKVITLRLGENATVDVDIRALMNIDEKTVVVDEPVANAETSKPEKAEVVEPKIEELPANEVKPAKEEPVEDEKASNQPKVEAKVEQVAQDKAEDAPQTAKAKKPRAKKTTTSKKTK